MSTQTENNETRKSLHYQLSVEEDFDRTEWLMSFLDEEDSGYKEDVDALKRVLTLIPEELVLKMPVSAIRFWSDRIFQDRLSWG